MIGNALDQALKLFGRGFLIAAFVPSLLFVTVVVYLVRGFEALRATVEGWAREGLKEATFDALLALVAVYLLAYVLYGVRTALHQLYQGQWPTPLNRWPASFFRDRQGQRMEQRQKTLDEKTTALNAFAWALDFDFQETYFAERVASEDASSRLQELRESHENFLERLKKDEKWEEWKYGCILREASLLQANRDQFASEDQAKIDSIVAEIKKAYHTDPTLIKATRHLRDVALREWTAAYNDRYDDFSADERWLRPTRLGNIASVQELYPFERYGIYLGEIWPRLTHVLAQDVRLRVEDANIYLDFTMVMSLLSIVAAAIAGYTGFDGPERSLVLRVLLFVFFLLSAWLFYRLAIQAMRGFGAEIQAAVDLFRLKLIDALDIERPRTPAGERNMWTEIRNFIAQADLPENIRLKEVEEKQGEQTTDA